MRTPAKFGLAVAIVVCLSIRPAAAQQPPSPSDARLRASVLATRDELLAKYRNAPIGQAQEAFRAFWRFYDATVLDLSSRFTSGPFEDDLLQHIFEIQNCLEQPLLVMEHSKDPRTAELKKTHAAELQELREWRRCGFDFSWGEGDWYLRDDPDFIAAVASQLPLGELGEYATFYGREARQRLAEDASLMVTWDDIRQRLVRWEEFARRHPTLRETPQKVKPEVNHMLGWYLFGIDNTLAYEDPVAGVADSLNSDLKASYQRFIKENTSSSFHDLIAGVYAIDKRHDFAPSTELIEFLRNRLTDPGLRRDLDRFERDLKR